MVRARRAGGVTKKLAAADTRQGQAEVHRARRILRGQACRGAEQGRRQRREDKGRVPPRPKRTGIDRLLAEASGGSPSASIYPTFSEVAQEAIELNRSKWKGAATFDQRQGVAQGLREPGHRRHRHRPGNVRPDHRGTGAAVEHEGLDRKEGPTGASSPR